MTTAHLDSSVLAVLKEIMGEDYPMLVDTYLKDSAHRLGELQPLSDPKALREAAHSFKGSSSNMGAARLADWCSQLEHLPLDAPEDLVAFLLGHITEEFAAVKAVFVAQGFPAQP